MIFLSKLRKTLMPFYNVEHLYALSILLQSIMVLSVSLDAQRCERKAKFRIHGACIARVLLYAYKFAQNASARRMPGYAHGNKSGAYWFWAIQSVSQSAASRLLLWEYRRCHRRISRPIRNRGVAIVDFAGRFAAFRRIRQFSALKRCDSLL